jgi:hypothetical protein
MVVYFNQKVEIMKKPKTSIKILIILATNNSNGRTKLKNRMALILRRNEAERKKHGVKFLYYNTLFQFGMHATKGSTNFSISTNPSISSYTSSFFFVFLHLFSFLSAIKKPCFYRFGPKASNSVCTLFSCTYLPEAPLAWACKALSMASFLDWISTSFSHDQKKKH